MSADKGLTYRDAGVDIDAGNELVRRIRSSIERTRRPEVIGGIGGFGGLCALPPGLADPILVAATDGVGTKLRLAIESGRHDTIGIDLVAMCANDVLVQGAAPLLFLDYYASGKLEVDVAERVVAGIAAGCELAGAALLGGETAEMPDHYAAGDYDLAGFCVGVAERVRLIDPARVAAGDVAIALASSGLHSNGYSLARAVLRKSGVRPEAQILGNRNLLETLIEPTRIYVRAILALLDCADVHAMAHITGGGIPENLPRVLPDNVCARIALDSWQRPEVFTWLQRAGGIAEHELLRTFNCGVGMIVIVPAQEADRAVDVLTKEGESAWILGLIESGSGDVVFET